MILLQLSSGQGPIESSQAVGLALRKIEAQCRTSGIALTIVEATPVLNANGCYKSLLLKLESKSNAKTAKRVAEAWQGSMLWICQSRHRPKHKRKNWFFNGRLYEFDERQFDSDITFRTCRASGAGGQHVNTTDSAVIATHTATGVSVRVESERSQHANKRIAVALLLQKLANLKEEQLNANEKSRWQQHWGLERGNPNRIFIGENFAERRA